MSDSQYLLEERPPTVEEYMGLRSRSGLSAKTAEAAARGLAGTWHGVTIRVQGQAVAMGRVVGDDGCFFQIVDIAVLPEHQRRGLGARVMDALMRELARRAPSSAYVSLLADGDATKLYEKFGFRPSAPASVGMFVTI